MIHVVYDVINGVVGNSGIKFLIGKKKIIFLILSLKYSSDYFTMFSCGVKWMFSWLGCRKKKKKKNLPLAGIEPHILPLLSEHANHWTTRPICKVSIFGTTFKLTGTNLVALI